MRSRILHPTENSIAGPILLDRNQIESLNEVLEAEWKKLEELRDAELAATVSRNMGSREQKDDALREQFLSVCAESHEFVGRRNVLLLLSDGRNVQAPDLATALRDPNLHDQRVAGITASLAMGARRVDVKTSRMNGGSLEVAVQPRGDDHMAECFAVLKNWQIAAASPWWLQAWRKCVGYHLFAWLVLFVLASTLAEHQQSGPDVRMLAANRAAFLVQHGVQPEQQAEALRLLLSAAYKIPLPAPDPRWLRPVNIGLAAYAVLLLACPTVEVGVGPGRWRLRWWRWYTTTVAGTIPLWLLSSSVWPALQPSIQRFLTP